MSKERVLITGGAGYIGSVLTRHLLENGYVVTCIDDIRYNQNSLLSFLDNSKFTFIFGDVRDEQLLKKILPDFDVIIPLAAIVGMPASDAKPTEAMSINRNSIELINNLRDSRQKIIFPNTNSGYGTKSGELYCTEETPLEPISLYGKTKVEAEKTITNSGKDFIILRLATVFGFSPRMRTDLLVNDFVFKAMMDGYIVIYEKDFKRNYIHIKDVARCFEYCIRNFESMKNQVYNVGLSNANLSKAELVEKIKQHIPKFDIIYREIGEDPDKRNYIVSNEKIEKAGFKPMFSIDDGVKELIKSYSVLFKNNPHKNA